MARDFFRQLHYGLNAAELAELQDRNPELYDYIERNWGLGSRGLSTAEFDLEECFTRLEREERDAADRGEVAGAYYDTWKIKGQLTGLFVELLDEISFNQPPGDGGLRPLARRALEEGAAVVTFNYDTLLEQFMIAESGQSWDPIPAYAAPFDLIEPRGWGSSEEFRPAGFPAQAHAAPLLKMHGSLNWFRVAGGGELVRDASGMLVQRPERLGQTLVRPVGSSITSTTGHTFVGPKGTLLEQLIITPVLHKDVEESPFAQIWRKAKDETRGCWRLVVCGYSFPPTDTATRRLFRESFAEGPPGELVVVNPDAKVVDLVKELCRFEGPTRAYGNLREFVGG